MVALNWSEGSKGANGEYPSNVTARFVQTSGDVLAGHHHKPLRSSPTSSELSTVDM